MNMCQMAAAVSHLQHDPRGHLISDEFRRLPVSGALYRRKTGSMIPNRLFLGNLTDLGWIDNRHIPVVFGTLNSIMKYRRTLTIL